MATTLAEEKFYEGGIPIRPGESIWFKIPAGLSERTYDHVFAMIKAILSMQVYGYIRNDILTEFASLIDEETE